MALITLVLLLVFCTLVLHPRLSAPPHWLTRVRTETEARLDPLAMITMIYALFGILLSPFFAYYPFDIMARLFANVILLLLALPAGAEQLVRHFSSRSPEATNEAVMESLGDIINGFARWQQVLAFAGLAAAVLLVFSMAR